MTIISRFFGRFFKLAPAETYEVCVERGIRVVMPDGVVLLADRYYPRKVGKRPVLLVRSPYGRGGFFSLFFGRILAERGFQVLIQSCRGTFGSGGIIDPFRQEQADGLATVEWMKKQDWYPGKFGTVGPSYLGYVQWAISRDAGPELKAMAILVSCSDMGLHQCKGGSFTLEDALTWTYQMHNQEKKLAFLRLIAISLGRTPRRVKRALQHLPLCDLDKLTCGREVEFWQNWVRHSSPEDEWWKPADHSKAVRDVKAPVLLIGGWYDIFLPWQLRDYRFLRETGCESRLLIGPWKHSQASFSPIAMRDVIAWLRFHLLDDQTCKPQSRVKLFVMGADEWRDYQDWPPNGYLPMRWHLHPRGKLAPEPPPESEPDRYRYNPADPTPSVGGPRLVDAGPKDNRSLESRSDVLLYTSVPLERDFEVVGEVKAELYAKSSLKCTDFFVRLCDVYPGGKSINICDGLISIRLNKLPIEKDGLIQIAFDLWPTAYLFRRGHRIRVQVSSGAHPRYVRNTGSCEPLSTATKLLIAENEIYHDPHHPSAIVLPTAEKSTM